MCSILSKAFVGLSLFLLLASCVVVEDLKHSKSKPSKVQREGVINVASRATGVTTDKAGMLTLLYVPVASTQIKGDISANLMHSVDIALQEAGYNAESGSSYSSADAGYLKAHLKELKLGNFFAINTATVSLKLRLETREGEILWEDVVRSRVKALNNDYDRTTTRAMNRLVRAMSKRFSQDDFYRASQRVKRHNAFLSESVELSQ